MRRLQQFFRRVFASSSHAPRTAFSGLRDVSDAGLAASDGGPSFKIAWRDVHRITAAMGRQTYDRTRVLTIDHARGRSIFLPEVEDLWAPFVEAAAIHLPGTMPEASWSRELERDPETSVRIYRRRG